MNVLVRNRVLLAAIVLETVLAATGQMRDLGLGRSADVVLALDIPEEVSLQVDGEFVFDLGRVLPGAAADPCTDRFPPPARCTFTFYNPTSATFRRGLAAGSTSDGHASCAAQHLRRVERRRAGLSDVGHPVGPGGRRVPPPRGLPLHPGRARGVPGGGGASGADPHRPGHPARASEVRENHGHVEAGDGAHHVRGLP
jgi:hypothetical protein